MKKKFSARDLLFYALVVVIFVATVYALTGLNADRPVYYSEIYDLFDDEQVRTVMVKDNRLTLELREQYQGSYTVSYNLISFDLFYRDFNDLIVKQYEHGIIDDFDYPAEFHMPDWVMTLVGTVVVLAIFFALWYFMFLRQGGGGGGGGGDKTSKFGRARTKSVTDEGKKVTFADVAGAEEEKQELQEVVEFLRDPKRFMALGARIPKGILLVGPPGTGKTLLAKAVAGEAGVHFLSISGSDFVELYVGVGASRVRDLFDQAKKNSPAIVFIDEIDAVGRQRGTGLGGGHDEREQTLNQLLVEMDGFGTNEGVIVMAATNRQDILDPALLRPGRFDRQIFVGAPDSKGREDILRIHARNKPLAEDVDLRELAKATGGFTGADLENLMNEAALLAARKKQRFLTMSDLHEAVIKVIAGPEKKSRVVIERERRLVAYHEAGHAVVDHALETADPVHQITIIPRGQSGGMTISLPQEDKSFQSRVELSERICGLLGGRAAEELVLGDISTGAGNDIQRASTIARNMVMRYGMSGKLGNVVFDTGHDEIFLGRDMAQAKTYSEETANLIDKEVKDLIDGAYQRCVDILRRDRDKLELVAQYLLEYENMDAATFEQVFTDPASLPKPGEKPAAPARPVRTEEDAEIDVPAPGDDTED